MATKTKSKIYNLDIVKDFLESIGGDYAVQVAEICSKKQKPLTDEDIGKKIPLKITEIRTILNRLHYRGIACYQKTKNSKTGWCSYTWEIKHGRIAELILERQSEEINKLEKDIDYEGSHVFFSAGKNMAEYPFEIAAEYDFKCPETGKPLEAINIKKRVNSLRKRISGMKTEVMELQQAV